MPSFADICGGQGQALRLRIDIRETMTSWTLGLKVVYWLPSSRCLVDET